MTAKNNIKHLAIIMDGNRRWATEKKLPKIMGHSEGSKNLRKISRAVRKLGIDYFTVYALSTENLKNRSKEELKHLFSLLGKLPEYIGDFDETNTKLRLIGNILELPKKTQEQLNKTVEKTKNNNGMTLTLALNYGARDEITRAVKKIVKKDISSDDISDEVIQSHLDTHDIPNVDLVIRTGGSKRLSNFLLWQSSYAELYFTDTYWPALKEKELHKIIEWYKSVKRNFGK